MSHGVARIWWDYQPCCTGLERQVLSAKDIAALDPQWRRRPCRYRQWEPRHDGPDDQQTS